MRERGRGVARWLSKVGRGDTSSRTVWCRTLTSDYCVGYNVQDVFGCRSCCCCCSTQVIKRTTSGDRPSERRGVAGRRAVPWRIASDVLVRGLVKGLRYIPDPSLKRQTPRATGTPNLATWAVCPAIAIAIMGRRPPGFFWLFAIRELVSNKPCVILAASWWVSGDGQCQDETR